MGKIKDYVNLAKSYGMDALALTDHGAMYGALELYTAARAADIKPIVGCELYVAPRSRHDKSGRSDADYSHLIALAKDYEGYQNLMKLVSYANLEGYYYKPRIDHELLARHSKGLIVLSSCIGGEVPKLLLQGDEQGAREVADKYRSIVGRENYFIELQDHPFEEQKQANEKLVQLARDMEIPLVATCDVHYPRAEDAEIQDILLCIQTGRMVSDQNRMRMSSATNYMRSPEEVAEAFKDYPDALANTLKVAEMCNLEIPMGKWILPDFAVPNGKTASEYLRQLCEEGIQKRYGEERQDVRERLEYELEVIETKGYVTYFLIVQDFARWSRDQEIAITTRGSAAGSLVSYLLYITSVDPLEYKLPFERFLNPYRPSPPDIDMDFEDSRREEVIQYVSQKYGQEKVAQIITFGTMEARAAVRDVGRVLGISYGDCDSVAKKIQQGWGIREALERSSDLKQWYESDPGIRRLLDVAERLEGVTRHASTHAAGVIISREPIVNYAPVQKDSSGSKPIIQYDMRMAEAVGLLKMDFLGLANLSILGRAVKNIEQSRGVTINLDELPLDDGSTYELLSSGETTGVFQLESAGMRTYIKELKPTCIQDVAAMISLYRPGPMEMIPSYIERKHDLSKVAYLVPQLEPLLKDSYGVLVYQDDILLISIEVAGYTWEEADKLRKAVGKKIKAELEAQRSKFIKGCISHGGLTQDQAVDLWEWLLPFARYGFNKGHAAAYALVAYQTAYLKANYPSEYMSAFLTIGTGNSEKIASGIGECRRMGIDVLPPNINRSVQGFALESDAAAPGKPVPIRFGLQAIKNVGAGPIQAIVAARNELPNRKFKSLDHLCASVDGRLVNRRVLESLIRAGAMDEFGTRAALLAGLEDAMAIGSRSQKASGAGQMSMFGGESSGEDWVGGMTLPSVPPETREQRLAWEREMLGVYLADHPLNDAMAASNSEDASLISDLSKEMIGQQVRAIGMLGGIRILTTKQKKSMLVGKLEDLTGKVDFVAFPEAYERNREYLTEDAILLIEGKLDERGDNLQLICDQVRPHKAEENGMDDVATETPDEENGQAASREEPAPAVEHKEFELRLYPESTDDLDADLEMMQELARLLKRYPGEDRVTVQIAVGERSIVIEPQNLRIMTSSALESDLEKLLGGRRWRKLEFGGEQQNSSVA